MEAIFHLHRATTNGFSFELQRSTWDKHFELPKSGSISQLSTVNENEKPQDLSCFLDVSDWPDLNQAISAPCTAQNSGSAPLKTET